MNLIVKGLDVVVKDEGDGPVVLLLHGWQSDLTAFEGLTQKLKENYRVIRPNLPGFGGSQVPSSDWGVSDYSDFIAEYFEKLKVPSPAVIIGHSMGGRIAMHGLAHNVFTAPKLVLIGSAGVPQSKSARSLGFLALAKIGKVVSIVLPGSIKQKLRSKLYGAAGSTDYLNAGELKQIFSNMINEDARKYAYKIKADTLLIYGKEDREAPPEFGKTFDRIIPNTTLEIIPNAGHFVHRDQAALVERKIQDFIK
ncbi:MAG: alpha/beta hydrolase [Candidatus Saccharimonadales bacterium]|nr:alpha/beta hydrolase [Candidatus Saccharimonadales bacterium]